MGTNEPAPLIDPHVLGNSILIFLFSCLQEGIPVLIVVSIGIVLLLLNVCACGAVIYQKHRVRQREDNLRRRIKRLSDAGMIRGQDTNDLEPPR